MSVKHYAEKIVGTNVEEFTDGSNSELFTFNKENEIYVIKITKKMSDYHIDKLKNLSNKDLIPKIYKIDKDFIIMDLLYGDTLNNIFYNQGLKLDELNNIFEKINIVINMWHREGFTHGDIHEDNIFIKNDGSILLIDPAGRLNSYEGDDISYIEDLKEELIEKLTSYLLHD